MSADRNILIQIDKISEDDLCYIEKDLSFQEKASIAFLLFGDNKANAEVMLQKLLVASLNKDNITDILIHFSTQREDWKEFLVEALAIVRANKVIRKLGLNQKEVKTHFLPHIKETSLHINKQLKMVYFLCEQLTPIEASDLVLSIQKNESTSQHIRFYQFECLEVFFLHWITQGRMQISDQSTDVSILAIYFKEKSMKASLNMLMDMTRGMFSSIRGQTNDAAQLVIASEDRVDVRDPMALDKWQENEQEDVNGAETLAICPPLQSSEYYEIDRDAAGLILIINQRVFERSQDPDVQHLLPNEPLKFRKGTDRDRDKLNATFSARGYNPIIRENLNHVQILREIGEVVRRSVGFHSLVICILSHGLEGCVFGADSVPVNISEIEDILTEKCLEDKPKLLIIQACQGDVIQKHAERLEHDGPQKKYRNHFDIVVAKSTVPGFASLRDVREGSWFIQTLCDKINELGDKEDIMGILTAVSNAIHQKKSLSNVKMTPLTSTTLKKKFKLPNKSK